jgi:hypothetical protein
MPVPSYTITFQPSSSGTVLAGQHPSPAHSGMSGVHVGSYDPVLKTYQSLGGPDMISSQGVNRHPVSRWHLHPRASSHRDTPPRDLLISRVPTIGTSHEGCPGHTHPARLVPTTRRKILPDRLNPHHTPKTHAKISSVVTTLSTPCALSTHNNHPPCITSQI